MTATMYIDSLGRDIHYRPGTSDENVITDVFTHQYHVPPLEHEPETVIDCGANIGLTMADYRQRWPHTGIFGIEMDARNVAVAHLNTDDPVLCAAVNDHPGSGWVLGYYNQDGAEWAYGLSEGAAWPTTRVSLSEIIDDLDWGRVAFVKVDIEGAERGLLQHPDELGHVDSLLVELHHGYTTGQAIIDLEACGFQAEEHNPHPAAVFARRP